MGDDSSTITNQQVCDYLSQNNHFFSSNPDILEQLELAESPEGTISLVQRQISQLQEKNAQLHEQMQLLIDNARQNMQLQSKVHKLCLSLMAEQELSQCLTLLFDVLKQEFNADEVALRLCYEQQPYTLAEAKHNIEQLQHHDERLNQFERVMKQHQPVCGRLSKTQKTVLFEGKEDQVASIACIPIGSDPCMGLLAIANQDEQRFHADMATDYLAFLGDTLSHLLVQYPPHYGR